MYRPYVGGKNIDRRSTILDIEIEYPVPRASAAWWFAGAALIGLAAALWFSQNPWPL